MKTIVIAMVLTFLGFSLYAGEGSNTVNMGQHGQLLVEVDGLMSDDGILKVLLFNAETGFPFNDWQAMYALDIELDDTKAMVNFKSIPFGKYAIYVYHDENANGKFDKNWAGTPKEGYGYSNISSVKRVIPLFSQSAFEFNEDGQLLKIETVQPVKGKNRGEEMTSNL